MKTASLPLLAGSAALPHRSSVYMTLLVKTRRADPSTNLAKTLSLKTTQQQNAFPTPACGISSSVSQNICVPASVDGKLCLKISVSLLVWMGNCATFYQTYFYYKPSRYSPFTETHFCNLFTQSRKADRYLLETLINSATKRTSRRILISESIFLSLGNKKKSQGLRSGE